VYVYLDSAGTEADPVPDNVPDKYTARLEDEVAFLRDQVRRQQEIIGQQALTMRALSAPESTPEPAEKEEPPATAEGSQTTASRTWWRFWR
jgi:hypothetical protein